MLYNVFLLLCTKRRCRLFDRFSMKQKCLIRFFLSVFESVTTMLILRNRESIRWKWNVMGLPSHKRRDAHLENGKIKVN